MLRPSPLCVREEDDRMTETHDFLMPDYFLSFSCKIGACRTACCNGWPVSFSLEDYFRLINEDCSEELRRKIDRGVHISLQPSPESYAQIAPQYDGSCPMLLSDGRCAIHTELGEATLADVCRLYPRGFRKVPAEASSGEGFEVSCANSCEGVLEMLFARQEPICFVHRKANLFMPPIPERICSFKTMGHEQEMRLHLIAVMQDRRMSLPQRLITVSSEMQKMETLMRDQDEPGMKSLLLSPWENALVTENASPAHLFAGLTYAEKLMTLIDEQNVSVRKYGTDALAYFDSDENTFTRYEIARQHFETRHPDWEICFEHMLVNHMFFTCFPFQDRPENIQMEFTALCVVYTLLRFLSLGCMALHEKETDLADICAAAFRLIEHTEFDRYASNAMHRLGQTDLDSLQNWIIL